MMEFRVVVSLLVFVLASCGGGSEGDDGGANPDANNFGTPELVNPVLTAVGSSSWTVSFAVRNTTSSDIVGLTLLRLTGPDAFPVFGVDDCHNSTEMYQWAPAAGATTSEQSVQFGASVTSNVSFVEVGCGEETVILNETGFDASPPFELWLEFFHENGATTTADATLQ